MHGPAKRDSLRRFNVVPMDCRRVFVAVELHDDGRQIFADANDDANFVTEPRAAFGSKLAQSEPLTGHKLFFIALRRHQILFF